MRVDVAIVGGGPAGAAAALYLARQGRKVAVFDRASFPRDKPCGEGLMPAGVEILADFGLLPALQAAGAPRIDGVAFSAPRGAEVYSAFPRGHGLGVRRTLLDAALADLLRKEPAIEFHENCPVSGIALESRMLKTQLGPVHARAVVIADGLRSPVRKALGWSSPPRRPHRYALVGHMKDDGPPSSLIRIRVCDRYEIFSSPSSTNERLVAVLGNKSILQGGQPEVRYRSFVESSHELSSAISVAGPFDVRAREVSSHGVFLLGDAAGFVDPVTGQGIETALVSARSLAHIVGRLIDGAIDCEQAAQVYRNYLRLAWRRRQLLTRVVLWLMASENRTRRAMATLQKHPIILKQLLGINCGEWGFSIISPLSWAALLMGSKGNWFFSAERQKLW